MKNLYKLKSIAINVVIALVSLFWVSMSLLVLQPTDVNPLVLIVEASLSIVIGVIIKTLCVKDGLVQGYKTEAWNEQLNKYNASCNTVVQYMERANNFKIHQKIEMTEEYRREVLTKEKMKYSMWFNLKGEYEPQKEIISPKQMKKMILLNKDVEKYTALTLRQRRVLKKCISITVKPLDIFSERNTDIIKKATQEEPTDKSYERQTLIKNLLVAILVALLGVYFMPKFFDNINWAEIIFSCIQLVIWLAFGVIQKYNAIDFVRFTRVNVLREKQVLIQQFKEGCEKGKYIENPYFEKGVEDEKVLD